MAETEDLKSAARYISKSKHMIVFTGAGISVESNIPPFRGENGLWAKYDPSLFEINYFLQHQEETWNLLKDVMWDFIGTAKPNRAHKAVNRLEKMGIVKAVVTQNVDVLHQKAGNTNVIEFHGSFQDIICLSCENREPLTKKVFDKLPPTCNSCGGIMKPDVIFFGEGIPPQALQNSLHQATATDLVLVIGTTGEVYPAAMVPIQAKQHGATIIEVNPQPSAFTHQITDIFLQGKAGDIMTSLLKEIEGNC